MQAKNGRTEIHRFRDHDIITPVNRLERAVSKKVVLRGEHPLERAEAAFARLADEFGDWMISECDRLDSARRAVKEHGLDKRLLDELFFAAHDIKGDAATFGFPLAAPAAASLCRVLEHSPDSTRMPLALIDQHVDAVRAIVREYDRPDIEEIAAALNHRLRQVADEFLVHENRHRPGYLDGVLSPPLAPDGNS